MIEKQAIVVSTVGGIARVEVLRESGCSSCSLKSGCGTGTIGQMFLSNRIRCVSVRLAAFPALVLHIILTHFRVIENSID